MKKKTGLKIAVSMLLGTLLINTQGIQKVGAGVLDYDNIPVEAYCLPVNVLDFCSKKGVEIHYYKEGDKEWEEAKEDGVLGRMKFSPDEVTGIFKPLVDVYETGDKQEDINTIIHELLHCYDKDYVSGTGARLSGQQYFNMVVYKSERSGFNEEHPAYKKMNEYFAYTGAYYFTDREYLKENFPMTYEYFDKLFREGKETQCDYFGNKWYVDVNTHEVIEE